MKHLQTCFFRTLYRYFPVPVCNTYVHSTLPETSTTRFQFISVCDQLHQIFSFFFRYWWNFLAVGRSILRSVVCLLTIRSNQVLGIALITELKSRTILPLQSTIFCFTSSTVNNRLSLSLIMSFKYSMLCLFQSGKNKTFYLLLYQCVVPQNLLVGIFFIDIFFRYELLIVKTTVGHVSIQW